MEQYLPVIIIGLIVVIGLVVHFVVLKKHVTDTVTSNPTPAPAPAQVAQPAQPTVVVVQPPAPQPAPPVAGTNAAAVGSDVMARMLGLDPNAAYVPKPEAPAPVSTAKWDGTDFWTVGRWQPAGPGGTYNNERTSGFFTADRTCTGGIDLFFNDQRQALLKVWDKADSASPVATIDVSGSCNFVEGHTYYMTIAPKDVGGYVLSGVDLHLPH